MRHDEAVKALRNVDIDPDNEAYLPVNDVSSYVREMVAGLRQLTAGEGRADLMHLDRLLKMAQEEAAKLSAQLIQ